MPDSRTFLQRISSYIELRRFTQRTKPQCVMAIPPVTLRAPAFKSESACTDRRRWCTSKHAAKHRNCHMVKNSDRMTGERGVTGEVHHLDAGYPVSGLKRREAPDISVSKH